MRSLVVALVLALVPFEANALDCALPYFCVCDFGAKTAVLTQHTIQGDGGVVLAVVDVRGADSGTVIGDVFAPEGEEVFGEREQIVLGLDEEGAVVGRVAVVGGRYFACPRGGFSADVGETMDAMLAPDCRTRVERLSGTKERTECDGPGLCAVTPSLGVASMFLVLGALLRARRGSRRGVST